MIAPALSKVFGNPYTAGGKKKNSIGGHTYLTPVRARPINDATTISYPNIQGGVTQGATPRVDDADEYDFNQPLPS